MIPWRSAILSVLLVIECVVCRFTRGSPPRRAFCDQYGDGMYDPAKHPADFLKKAMKDLGISSSAGWKSAGPKGGGKDSRGGPPP
eukprot:3573434-Amphidinium_carterae.1